jgi:hypothetical protein
MTVTNVSLDLGLSDRTRADDVTLTGGRINGFDVKLNEEGGVSPALGKEI